MNSVEPEKLYWTKMLSGRTKVVLEGLIANAKVFGCIAPENKPFDLISIEIRSDVAILTSPVSCSFTAHAPSSSL